MSLSSQHGEHYRMELFEEDNFSGQCVELCDDCPFLQARGLTKNCINSIKVYGDGAYVSLRPFILFDLTERRAHKTCPKTFPSLSLSNELNLCETGHFRLTCYKVISHNIFSHLSFVVLNKADSSINRCKHKYIWSVLIFCRRRKQTGWVKRKTKASIQRKSSLAYVQGKLF